MDRQELLDLIQEVTESTSVQEEAGILIDSLQDSLSTAIAEANWPKVVELRDQLKASKEKLAAAFAANIPPAPPAPEPEV